MSARTALPVLLLALFLSLLTLPARADIAFPHPCDRRSKKKEGDPCGNGSGTCRIIKCVYGRYEGEENIEDFQYDCLRCMSPEAFADKQREAAARAQVLRARKFRWGVTVLGLGCVITFAWYDWRRRSKARSADSASNEKA